MNILLSNTDPLVKMLPVVVLPFLFGFLALIVYSILKDSFKRRKIQKNLLKEKREFDRVRTAK